MIPHNYVNASDNPAQYVADEIGRQEVTLEWYLENMADCPVFAWVGKEVSDMGLDPWRVNPDVELAVEKGWRLFVQKKDMPVNV